MKKVLALLLALTMVLGLAACGGKPATPAADGAATGDKAPADDAAATADGEKKFRIAMITDSSIADGGWGAACYNAMTTVAEQLGWQADYSDLIAQSDYANAMITYCDLGYDAIFLPGNQYTDAVDQVCKDYPNISFIHMNRTADPHDNVTAIRPNTEHIGWIAGTLAGLTSKTGVLGFIGGIESDTTTSKLQNYEAAALKVNPDIKVVPAYAGTYSDTAKGMELANAMIGQGADVIFGDASGVESGGRQAIDAENTKRGAIEVFNIGQPADILGQNPCVISSVVTDNAGMLKMAMENVMNGEIEGKLILGGLDNGGVTVGKLNDELISKEIQDQFNAYIEEMKAGTFSVK